MSERWYTRRSGGKLYLGLIDDATGEALDAGAEVIANVAENPDELIAESDQLPLNEEYILGFVKGIAADLLQTDNVYRQDFIFDYENMKRRLRATNSRGASGGIKPVKVANL